MDDLNIFESATPQTGEFFKFSKIGDEIQGTYIDARNGVDSFGNEQIIYTLLDKDGKIWNYGVRSQVTVIHDQMRNIRFGQIVGFRYDEDKPSKVKPGTMAKIVRIYADPKLVNREWLEQRKELEEQFGPKTVIPATHTETESKTEPKTDADVEEFPDTDTVVEAEKASSKNEAIDAIRNLAVTKGLTTADMKQAEADATIEKFTKLKLNEDNFTKVIIALTSFTGK